MFTQREFQIALGRKMGSFLPILGPFIEACVRRMGTHALRLSILMGMALHLHLGFLVITFDASMIGWFAAWSNRFEQRVYQ